MPPTLRPGIQRHSGRFRAVVALAAGLGDRRPGGNRRVRERSASAHAGADPGPVRQPGHQPASGAITVHLPCNGGVESDPQIPGDAGAEECRLREHGVPHGCRRRHPQRRQLLRQVHGRRLWRGAGLVTSRRMAVWHAQRTVLIVGEGRHETAFLNHVKQLYVQLGFGLAVAIKNARGKGAKHVIEWAARQVANTAYDTVAAMLDTDEDWSPALATQARTKKIQVLASDPCFDAVMLRLLGQRAVGDAKALKKMLA